LFPPESVVLLVVAPLNKLKLCFITKTMQLDVAQDLFVMPNLQEQQFCGLREIM
jgi:hypothetical protein